MFSKKEIKTSDSPWTEDPTAAYKNFLQYAGQEANQAVAHNRAVLSAFGSHPPSESETDIKVFAHNGAFFPLSTAVSHNLYCSKITIRNVKNACFMFNFGEEIIPRILGIDVDDALVGARLNIAYRNIVPSEFSQATQLAGPMGFHEYLIDGLGFDKDAAVTFFANSNFDNTPIQIVLENCKGFCMVEGLDAEALARVLVNKCDKDAFDVDLMVKRSLTPT